MGASATLALLLVGAATAAADVVPAARRINWQPGVPGGIPARTTICANVVSDFGAVGDGVRDDAPAIQRAITACGVGQVVFVPAGTYRLNSQLTIAKGVVLRGAGVGATRLKTYAAWHGIQLGNFPSSPVATNVSGSPAKGETTVTVASAANMQVGDYISIDQINDNVENSALQDLKQLSLRALNLIVQTTQGAFRRA